MIKAKNFLLFSALVLIGFALASCDTNNSLPATGTYDIGASADIKAVTVFYPTDIRTSGRTYNTVTLTGGFGNTKEDMYWLANSLVSQNVIVFATSAAVNNTVEGYEKAHKAAYKLIVNANNDAKGELYQKVDLIGLIGYSMGGGGAINAAQDLGLGVKTVIGLAPYEPEALLTGVSADVLMMVGNTDTVAPADKHADVAFANLPSSIKKARAIIAGPTGFNHLDFVGGTTERAEQQKPVKELVNAWIKYILDGDTGAYAIVKTPPEPITYKSINF